MRSRSFSSFWWISLQSFGQPRSVISSAHHLTFGGVIHCGSSCAVSHSANALGLTISPLQAVWQISSKAVGVGSHREQWRKAFGQGGRSPSDPIPHFPRPWVGLFRFGWKCRHWLHRTSARTVADSAFVSGVGAVAGGTGRVGTSPPLVAFRPSHFLPAQLGMGRMPARHSCKSSA